MLTSVELFAGAGGLGMGLTLAGFRHLAVIERDQWACDTIRRNQACGHPLVADWPLWHGDVRDFDDDSLVDRIDVVAGGPPCQPFSMGGRHRGFRDGRDMFPAMAEIVRRLRPRAFIAENVKGLIRPAFADYFDHVRARLAFPEIVPRANEDWTGHLRRLRAHQRTGSRSGLTYDVSFRVLNAADHGVPQKRERVFIVGLRGDLATGCQFPSPTHSFDALSREQYITGEYWERHRIPGNRRPAATPAQLARLNARAPAGGAAWRTVRDALDDMPDPEFDAAAARSYHDHRFQPGVRFYPGHTGSALDLPAKTLKAGDHGVPGGENALVRDDGSGRYFTVREAARLQTFPDDYRFGGSWSEVMRQLGNAVPVVLGRAVAAQVMRELLSDNLRDSRRDLVATAAG
jgi:DNA (cytosine-5)-methyltransferase 1